MEKNKIIKKAVTGFVIGSMVLSMGVGAFAADVEGTTFVDKGTKFGYGREFKRNQAKDFKEKGFKMDSKEKGEGFETMLSALVEDGTISQETTDKAARYFAEKAEERKLEFEKMKNMTREERKALRTEKPAQRLNPLDELVAEGILTEAQADTIKEKHESIKKEQRHVQINEKLNALVKDGTLTQEKVDEVVKYLEEKAEERKLEFEKMKDMTKEEREAIWKQNKVERPNPLNDLVSEGILSQDQADAISKVMIKHHHGGAREPQRLMK